MFLYQVGRIETRRRALECKNAVKSLANYKSEEKDDEILEV